MVGHHWASAEATIIATQVAVETAAGYVNRLEYAVDVQPANGPVFQTTLREPKFIVGGFSQPSVGDVVGVLFDPKTNEAKFDTSDPRLKISTREDAKRATFRAAATAGPGTAPPVGPGQMQVLSGTDAAPILDVLLSSGTLGVGDLHAAPRDDDDPAERLEKLRALKTKGLIDDAEYATQRQKIIEGV